MGRRKQKKASPCGQGIAFGSGDGVGWGLFSIGKPRGDVAAVLDGGAAYVSGRESFNFAIVD